jgi:hypothetical protein
MKNIMSTTGVNEDIARLALLRELRNSKVNLRRANNESSTTGKKKRRARFDDQAGDDGEWKIPRTTITNCKVTEGLSSDGTVYTTFLKLSPPSLLSAEENASLTFTFGRRHYKSISLAGLAKTSCGCASASSCQFDIFSRYRCPCNNKKQKKTKALVSSNAAFL